MPNIDASRLPEKPELAQERKRAKDLFKAVCSNDGDAIARFRSHHPRFADLTPDALRAAKVKLSDAQWVIAREYGFPSWPSLKAHIQQVSGRAGTAPHSVLMCNDEATPMAFVVYLLQHVFEKSEDDAHEIMLDTHHHGVGVCGVYDRREDAEAKVAEAKALARQHGHPLELTYAYGDAAQNARPARQLEKDLGMARAKLVRFDDTDMQVELVDGRTLSVPLAWCGMWVGGWLGFSLVPLFAGACFAAWRLSRPRLLLYAAPAVVMLGLHAALASFYTRYNFALIGPFSVAAAWVIASAMSRFGRYDSILELGLGSSRGNQK